jgi:hypothetical protein
MATDEIYSDKQLIMWRTGPPAMLRVAGALDHFNADAVAKVLNLELASADGLPAGFLDGASDGPSGDRDLHVDLSRLEFSDVTGIRMLISVAENAVSGRRLVLRGLPPLIRKVMNVVGWGDLQTLVIDESA